MTENETGNVVVYIRVWLRGLASRTAYAERGIRYEFDPEALFEAHRQNFGEAGEPRQITFNKEGVNARRLCKVLHERGLRLTDVYLAIPSSDTAPRPAPPSFLVGVFTTGAGSGLSESNRKRFGDALYADFGRIEIRADNSDPSKTFEWISLSGTTRPQIDGSREIAFGGNGWSLSPKAPEVRTLAKAMTA